MTTILETLGFAVFVRGDSGNLEVAGAVPPWLREVWPVAADARTVAALAEVSPFLENFLIDAEVCWQEGSAHRVTSGPWVERDVNGREISLEATALTADDQAVLLIERLGEAFETKKALLQKARENVIAYQRLNTEMQKKEILLHCVAEDLNAALNNVITALHLLELEQNPTAARHLLGLASRATEEQQSLIHKVLGAFAEELDGLYGRAGKERAESKLPAVVRRAAESAAPMFAEKGVRLAALPADLAETRIPAHPDHLERVIANLLENALHHTVAGHDVAILVEDEPESVLLRVEDSGPEFPPDVTARLFAKFEPSETRSTTVVLRLHFCRITVENCNGEIGYRPRENGGNCFWIRLPKLLPPR